MIECPPRQAVLQYQHCPECGHGTTCFRNACDTACLVAASRGRGARLAVLVATHPSTNLLRAPPYFEFFMDIQDYRLCQLHRFGLLRVPPARFVMGLLVAIASLARVPGHFPTQGPVGSPRTFCNISKGYVLHSHRAQPVAFGLGQLSITPFHLSTASLGRPENIPACRLLRWCTYDLNLRMLYRFSSSSFEAHFQNFYATFFYYPPTELSKIKIRLRPFTLLID